MTSNSYKISFKVHTWCHQISVESPKTISLRCTLPLLSFHLTFHIIIDLLTTQTASWSDILNKTAIIFPLQPNDDAQHNQDCRFSHNKEQTIGEDQILSSAIHNNQSHTLSLALWQGFRWQADWLHRNDLISVPATMKVALSSISYHRVGNLIKDRNFDAMVAKKTRYQQYCKGVLHKTSTKQVRRKVPSWEEPFRPEHIKCHGNRHCIDQIRQKCLVHGLRVIGKVNYLSDCVFSINEVCNYSYTQCFEMSEKGTKVTRLLFQMF